MRKSLLVLGLFALVGILPVACSDQEPTSPSEPQFGKGKPADCNLGDLQALADQIRDDIEDLFSAKKKAKAANEIFNNIERKVCREMYPDALNMALDFYEMTFDQLPDKLNGDEGDAAALVSLVFQFASDPAGPGAPPIPPGALEPTGGIGIVYPGTNDTIWTNNDEAAFVANAGSFAGNGPVTVVLTRLTDPQPGVPNYPVFGYQAYPEAYDFSANFELIGDAEFWMCVVTDPPEPPFDRLVIGHDLGEENSELLTPRLVEDFPGQVLDCTGAQYIDPPAVASAEGPDWLELAGYLLQPVAERFLDVKPLNASFFGGKGLGGRGTSFSAFAPVDGLQEHPVLAFDRSELNQEVGEETVNYYYIGVTNWTDFPAELFELTSEFGPCGGNPTPSRTWVEIYDASDGSRIYGFCGFELPDNLIEFWFATAAGQAPPDVYIEIWDREEDVRYRSNTIVIPTVFNTLTVEGDGSGTGTITRAPDISCSYDGEVSSGDCAHSAEEWVRYGGLTATPDEGSEFTGWSGACSGTDPCLVEMDADKTATATFSSAETFTLTVVVIGDGYVDDESESIGCPETCSAEFDSGESVFLWSSEGEGSFLSDIIGNCEDGGDPDCTIIMDEDQLVEFIFADIIG